MRDGKLIFHPKGTLIRQIVDRAKGCEGCYFAGKADDGNCGKPDGLEYICVDPQTNKECIFISIKENAINKITDPLKERAEQLVESGKMLCGL
jgi:hypothetical protein